MTGLPQDEDVRIILFPGAGSLSVRLKGSMNPPDRADLSCGPAGTEKRTITEFTGLSGK
ncbi:MAG: hypothetical protein WC379_12785 [Methanoregula sp.]|jgi:hypothetical protein